MTVGAAMNSPLFAAIPYQGALRHQDSLNGKPRDLALRQRSLRLVSSDMKRSSVATRWQSVANTSSGARTLSIARHHNAGSVYERIKSILLQRSWVPGELLQIGILAQELGTSTTPVREALVRLAAERLIAYAPKKGFLIKAITEDELQGLYIVNQMYLQTALNYSCERAGNIPEIHSSGSEHSPVGSGGAMSLAFITENLFARIAALSGIEEIVAMVGNINDRLRRPRIAEYAIIDGMLEEMSVIADLFAADERQKLHEEIRRYHEVRLRMRPSICKELLSMSFARR